MIVDFHTHIFPPDVIERRQDFAAREPAFALIYGNPSARMVDAEGLVRAMDEEGVDKAVTFGFPWADQGINRDHNDYILGAAGRYPDRLVPFACLNPLAPGAGEETARCIEKGARGVGEIAFYDRVIDEEVIDHLRPVLEILKDANLPLLIHTNEPVGHIYPGKSMKNLTEIELLVKSFPENTFILAHWGGGIFFFELMKELKALFRNVYYDTAASPFLYQPEIYIVAGQIIGFDRILLGTDYPLIRSQRYLKQISETVHDDEKVRMVCRGNALRLLNLQEKAL